MHTPLPVEAQDVKGYDRFPLVRGPGAERRHLLVAKVAVGRREGRRRARKAGFEAELRAEVIPAPARCRADPTLADSNTFTGLQQRPSLLLA
jgi:hypothetical protein